MTTDHELLEGIDDNRWDFKDPPTHVFRARKGLDREIVELISGKKEEPQWMLDFRLKALDHFEKTPNARVGWGSIPNEFG